MASAYAQRMVVPDEFPAALKEYTREALRSLPAGECSAPPSAHTEH